MSTPCARLSRRQRRATPRRFALLLVDGVLAASGAARVAALWCAPDSIYFWLARPVEVWCGLARDARLYAGPWPIVAHPPCGPWGKFRAVAREGREHGILAMAHVHRWGGVVEHPVGSCLFREHGRPEGRIQQVRQGDYGHPAPKPTLLYWHMGGVSNG